jgi:hypothetical protein
VDGTLKPGMAAPSGEQLARETGFAAMTCRAALRVLLDEGALIRVSPTGRGLVADPDADGRELELAQELAGRRRHAGLTQLELAGKLGVSLTTVGHAETAVAVPRVLGRGGPGAGRTRIHAGPVRRLEGRPGGRPADCGRGGEPPGSACRAWRAGRGRHHAPLDPGTRYGQVG